MRRFWWLALAVGCVERFPETEGQSKTFPGPYGVLEVDTDGGRIGIQVGTGDAVAMEFLPSGSDAWSADDSGGNLKLVASCLGETEPGCNGGFVLTVPANQEIHARTGDGQLAFDGPLGGVLDGQTSSGPLEVIGLGAADLTFLTGTGAVDFAAVEVPRAVSIDTGSSAVAMEVPAGGYALDLDSNGVVNVDPAITDDPSGPVLRVHSGTGNIGIVPTE